MSRVNKIETIQDSSVKKHHFSIIEMSVYLLMICFLVVSMPQSDSMYWVSRIIQFVEVVCFLYLGALYITKSKIKQPIIHNLIHLYWLVMVFMSFTTLPNMQFTECFRWMNVCIFLFFSKTYWQRDMAGSMHIMAVVLSLLCYLNAMLYIMFPDGLWYDFQWKGTGDPRRYLFGNYNATGMVILLALLVQGIYVLLTNKGKWNMLFLICVGVLTVWQMGSMTSTIGLAILGFYFIFRRMIKHPFAWISLFFFCYISFFVLVVYLGNSIEGVGLLTEFVENILSKDTSFSNRTDLWFASIQQIIQSPWIGYGPQGIDWMVSHIGGSGPHNLLLMILLQGGLLLLSIFVGIVFSVFRVLYKQNSPVANFVAVAVCVLLLMSLFETYNIVIIFVFLIIAYSIVYEKGTTEIEKYK